jgi:hypothetical protein
MRRPWAGPSCAAWRGAGVGSEGGSGWNCEGSVLLPRAAAASAAAASRISGASPPDAPLYASRVPCASARLARKRRCFSALQPTDADGEPCQACAAVKLHEMLHVVKLRSSSRVANVGVGAVPTLAARSPGCSALPKASLSLRRCALCFPAHILERVSWPSARARRRPSRRACMLDWPAQRAAAGTRHSKSRAPLHGRRAPLRPKSRGGPSCSCAWSCCDLACCVTHAHA